MTPDDIRKVPLRGVPYSANGGAQIFSDPMNDPKFWHERFNAQDEGRERQRIERAKAGGDESLFKIIVAEDIGEPEPIAMSAGGLLLSSGVHRINGPAGGGKTRLAYWEILQRVKKQRESWWIYDLEMGPERFKQAMMQLGAEEDDLELISYVTTKDEVTPDLIQNGRALCRICIDSGGNGILYDSQTPFLSASGINENDPQGVRAWTEAAARPMADNGGTAIIIDHTGHGEMERGRGSSDKAAGCDVDMFLSVITPFAIGMDGAVRLSLTKDRSGTILPKSSIRIITRCYEEGYIDFHPEQWDTEYVIKEDEDVAEILELILIDTGQDYATAGELQNKMGGSKQDKLAAIDRAVHDGNVIKKKSGRSFQYSLPDQ